MSSPTFNLSVGKVARMTRDLAFAFRLGEQKALNLRISIEQEIAVARKRKEPDEAKIASLESSITKDCNRIFTNHATLPVYYLVRTPSASASAELPGKPLSVQLAATAKATVLELRIQDGEDDYAWFGRIRDWILENAETIISSAGTDRGPEHRALRLPNPPATMFTECDAITNLNSRANSRNPTLAGHFWKYSHNFQKDPTIVNFHERFPGLASAFKEGKFKGEVERFVRSLREVPFAYMFCTGCPGSGKTTTALNIVEAVMSGPVEAITIANSTHDIYGAPPAPASADAISGEVQPSTNAVNDAWEPSTDVNKDPTADATTDEQENTTGVTDVPQYVLSPTSAYNLQCGLCLIQQPVPPTDIACTTPSLAPVTEPEHIVDKAQQYVDSIIQKQGTKCFGVPALDNIGEDEGEVPYNNYEEPTVNEYTKAAGFKSADDTPADPEPFGIDASSHRTAGKADRALAKFLNGITTGKFKETHPTHVPGSISELGRGIAEGNPKEWPDVMHAWCEKLNDPDAFAVNITKHKEHRVI
ncbi:hypothetical protein FPCIR_14101 [Fusarium pseudocircinatum]|uniref:Uncharacterized protein n=1 Tax=Fusarium pseudocircinatum TaxID=56676 RepID=A0A8H5KH32_9HYPO|nr:hypothetical protein FPCIR_14101 [Fusarium pseudocircinatum]